jgi:hypothetical protein
MNSHTLEDRRLIASILSEVALLGVEVLITEGDEVLNASGGLLLVDLPEGDRAILIDGVELATKKIDLEFILNGKRFIGSAQRLEQNPIYFSIPKTMRIEDRRGRVRYQFDNDRGCEVIFSHRTIPGIPINFTQDYFACLVSDDQAEVLSPNKMSGSVVVYGFDCKRGLTLPKVDLVDVRNSDKGSILVFKIADKSGLKATQQSKKENRSGDRVEIKNTEKWINLRSEGVVPEKNLTARIKSVSKIGFTVEIPSGEQPLIGFVYSVLEFDSTFHCVRDSGTEWVFVLDAFRDGGVRWYDFLGKNSPFLIEEVKNAESISQLLTECGFIKGQRRKYYSKTSTISFVDRWLKDSTLFKRFVERYNESELSSHVSAVRVSGAGWLIQEGATGIHKQSGIRSVMERVLSQLKTETITYRGSASLYGTIYDPKIRPVHEMWTALHSDRGLRLKCAHLDYSQLPESEEGAVNEYVASDVDLIQYSDLLNYAPELFHEFFGVFEIKSGSSELNRRYKALSSQYGVELECFRDSQSRVAALVYRLKGPYALNSSGLVNSVFVYWVEDDEKKKNSLIKSIIGSKICHGTRDLLVLSPEKLPDLAFDRVFDLIIDRIKNWSTIRNENESAA